MVCFYRNGANTQRGPNVPTKPADWTKAHFLHGYERCTKEFGVKACKVMCEGSKAMMKLLTPAPI